MTKRITARNLAADFVQNNLGWDNRFFRTIKDLIVKPGILLRSYFDGTRKKYVAPFTFLAIGMTIAIFTFNAFDDKYIEANQQFQESQMQWMADVIGGPYEDEKFRKEQLSNTETMARFQLKYFNILVVLLLPLYTFIAFLVYRKPYNYGEHLVVNSYVQGVGFLSITFLFLLSLFTHPLVFASNMFLLIPFYTYVYAKLYKLTVAEAILKLLKFLGLLLLFVLGFFILSFLIGYLGSRLAQAFE